MHQQPRAIMCARRVNMSQMALSSGMGTEEPVVLAIRRDRADCIHLVFTHSTRDRPNGGNWNACPWKINRRESKINIKSIVALTSLDTVFLTERRFLSCHNMIRYMLMEPSMVNRVVSSYHMTLERNLRV